MEDRYHDIYRVINVTRGHNGIGYENYWLYIHKRDCSKVICKREEGKMDGYVGYFVEDDSRIPGIMKCYERKFRRVYE